VDREAAIAGVADAVRSLARFVGADTIALGRVSPQALAAPLRRAISAGGSHGR
jgi:hypothetical protein